MLREAGNHSESYDLCSYYGMKLAGIESAGMQAQLFSVLLKWWPERHSVSLWIDGIKDTYDGKWYYYSYKKTPAFPDLIWVNNAAKERGCLAAVSTDTVFKVAGYNCSGEHIPICEF